MEFLLNLLKKQHDIDFKLDCLYALYKEVMCDEEFSMHTRQLRSSLFEVSQEVDDTLSLDFYETEVFEIEEALKEHTKDFELKLSKIQPLTKEQYKALQIEDYPIEYGYLEDDYETLVLDDRYDDLFISERPY